MRDFLNALLYALRWMSRSRLLLAGLYIAATFFFAWRFASMRHGLYEDKIRLELPYSLESQGLTDKIARALMKPVVTRPAKSIRLDDATVLRRVSPVSYNQVIEARSESLALNVWTSIDLQQTTPEGTTDNSFDIPMEITFVPTKLGGQKSFGGFYYKPSDPDFNLQQVVDAEVRIDPSWHFQTPTLTGAQLMKIESIVVTNALRSKIKSQSEGVYKVYLAMPLVETERLQRFFLASSGFTSDLSDNWSRMVYFSLTTITTLGFGDIVPISAEARKWVTIEALTGLCLMGLFLNSLAK